MYIYVYILKATESFEVMKNANVLKFAGQRDKLLPNIFSTDTPEENIWRKVRKVSNKIRHDKNILISAFV